MKNYWQEVKVGDIGEVVGGGTPSTKCSDYYGGDIPWITPKDLSNFRNRYISRGERMISKLGLENSSAKMLPPFSVLFTSRAPIGYIAIAKNELCTNQGFKSIIPDPKKCDALFLYYLLKYKKNDIESIANGSTFQEVSGTALKNFEVSIPPLDEQRKIAGILSALDDKIELNNKINQNLDWEDYFRICRRIYELEKENQNLEAQAQAIFKSWFVDFEPFGGKMPAGWGQGCLSDVLSVIESGSRPKGGSESSGVPSIGAENIDGIGHYDYSKEKYINRDFFQNLRHGKVNSGDILLYKDGAYVGKVSMALNGFPHEICAVNEHVFILRTNERLPSQSYLYLFLAQHSIRNKIATLGSAKAAQPGVNQSDIKGIALTIPNKRTIQAFENIASSLFSKIVQNSIQSRRLSQLRDTLLPKLMSGEIDVSDVAV